MYKSEKGITFMVLVITVIVLILIGTAVAGAAISTYKDSKVKVFMKELDTIKEKASLYEDKVKVNSSLTPLANVGKAASEIDTAKNILDSLENASGDKKLSSVDYSSEDKYKNYRVLTATELNAILELEEINRQVIIDIVTKEVYSLIPVEYGGEEYYSADDIRGAK